MIVSDREWGFRPLILCGVSALAMGLAAPAVAQDTDETDEAEDQERVVVTGSRIRKDEFSATAPVQIIDPEIAELKGTNSTADLIQSSSLAAGSAQVTSAFSSAFVTNGGAGVQTISLRGLGAERTLVLLNGRRAGPAGVRGGVNSFDLNVIPQSLISSVEILKDGASSIYGSDAVAGVVNIITKRDTDGIELDAFYSQPFETGGEEIRGSATWGKTFRRGHIQASLDYYHRVELDRGDRKYLDCPQEYLFTEDGRRADPVDPRTGQFACNDTLWGHIWLYDYTYYYSPNGGNLNDPLGNRIRRMQYDYAGDNLGSHIPPLAPPLDPFQFSAPEGWFPVGFNPETYPVENAYHPFMSAQTVIPRTERFTAYLDGAYEVTDWAEAYGEFLLNRRETEVTNFRQFWQFGFTENFDGEGFGDPFAPGWTGAALISPTGITDWFGSAERVDYMRTVVGLRGDFDGSVLGSFFNSWEWDVHGQYSRSDGKYYRQQILQDAVDTQDFRTSSCAGTVTPVSGRDCLDINWTNPEFMAGNLTPEERAFLFDTEEGNTVYTQLNFEGIVSGDLFELPAGTLGVALGAVWRRDEIKDTPGEITRLGNAWGVSTAGITEGSSTTQEIFGELSVPLLKDLPLVQSLHLDMAGRYTDVDTYGDGTTYKLGVNWQVTDWLRLRATRGTSFRAPALFELFLADQTSSLSQRQIDPCIQWEDNLATGGISQRVADNCAADGIPPDHTGAGVTATIITGGGIGVLEAETSLAETFSVIFTPDFLMPEGTKLSLALDYFEIEVNGEVTQLGAGNIVGGCYASEFFPTDPLCDLFTRGQTAAPNNVATVRDSFININSQVNRGLDATVRIDQELPGDWGDVSLFTQMTWQFQDDVALFEGTTVSTNGESGEPKFVGDLNLIWRAPHDLTVFYGLDVRGRTSDNTDYIAANGDICGDFTVYTETVCVDLETETTFYHSLSVTKDFPDLTLTLGIANLFDQTPPRISSQYVNTREISTVGQAPFVSNFDFLGRRAFVSVKKKF